MNTSLLCAWINCLLILINIWALKEDIHPYLRMHHFFTFYLVPGWLAGRLVGMTVTEFSVFALEEARHVSPALRREGKSNSLNPICVLGYTSVVNSPFKFLN